MCRFALYLGPPITLDMLITRPEHSIVRQSFKSRMRIEPLNGDGFGVAWYVPEISPEPAAFRSIQPAWNDNNLRDLARLTRSSVILAHVRAATSGLGVSQANCHPFTAGRLAFMHNGSIPDFVSIKRRFQQRLSDESFLTIRGTTDTEHIFALFQDRYRDLTAGGRADGADPAEILAAALRETIAEVVQLIRSAGIVRTSHLNIAVSDGTAAVAARFASGETEALTLFVSAGRQFVCEETACRMVESDEAHRAVIVASEPLTEDLTWKPVPANHLTLIRPDLSVTFRELP